MNDKNTELKDMVNYCCARSSDIDMFVLRMAAKLDVEDRYPDMKRILRDVIVEIISEKDDSVEDMLATVRNTTALMVAFDHDEWRVKDSQGDDLHIGSLFTFNNGDDEDAYCVCALGVNRILYWDDSEETYEWIDPSKVSKYTIMF